MTPARKSEPPAYFFGFYDGQLCVVDSAGDAIMKVPPEDVEKVVDILVTDGSSLSGLVDALAEGLKLGFNVVEWDMTD